MTCSPRLSYACEDCGRCTCSRHLREYYMVTNALWRRHGARGESGMLCIGCLEARLGRPLVRADFTDCPINTAPGMPRSNRLWRRLTSPPGPLTPSR